MRQRRAREEERQAAECAQRGAAELEAMEYEIGATARARAVRREARKEAWRQ